jgi:light-harvesting complex 1 beta chain
MAPTVSGETAVSANYIMEFKTMAEQASLSGLTEQQAKEFHEQFKITYTAYVGLAALVHLFIIAANPWF